MATLLEKIQSARNEGYTDQEISIYMSQSDPRFAEALQEGYSLGDVASFLTTRQTQNPAVQFDPLSVGQLSEQDQARGSAAQAQFRNVAGQAIQNFPRSAANLAGDVFSAITSPLQTAKAVLDLGAGAIQAALPESIVQAIGADPKSREVVAQVGQFYIDRYGSVEGATKAIAEDPAGVLADVASIAFGGGAALRGAAGATNLATGGRVTLPSVQAAGETLRAGGAMIDPLAIVGRGVTSAARGTGNVLAPVLGMTTGAGQEPIRQAFTAGREGGARAEQFRANISGTADQMDILTAAKENLVALRNDRSQAYQSGMVNIANDKTQLSFSGIDNAIKKAEGRTRYQNKVVDQQAADALNEAKDVINGWKQSDPVLYHTPEGMDALKQSIGAILDNLEPNKNAFNTVNQVYNSVKSEIVKQAPTYANTMKSYTDASETIREIEKSLSLGNKSSADTAMRKLQSLMRDNVNTNFGMRTRVGRQLEEQGGNMMMPGLAGQSLQSLAPRGIQGATAIGQTGVAGMIGGIPAAIGSAVASSPRAVGEAAFITGVGARGMDAVRKIPALLSPDLYNLLYQTERTTQ